MLQIVMDTEFENVYKVARKAESIENYSRSDKLDRAPVDPANLPNAGNYPIQFYDDQRFWEQALKRQIRWGQRISCFGGAISEWVSRVPGLYWVPGSEKIRAVSENIIETIGNIHALSPIGKSQVVIGGIGTLRLPPDRDYYHLCTYSTSMNASTGVPMLVSAEVWDHYQLEEGVAVDIRECQWREMTTEWAKQFPSIGEIVRGCLVVDDIEAIIVQGKGIATQIHPFSIMEYYTSEGEILHDFVFATAVTNQPDYRDIVRQFFESYRTSNGRFGEYLTAGDIAQPMWNSKSRTPQDLLEIDENAQSHLDVLLARIKGTFARGKTIDAINRELLKNYPEVTSMRRLAVQYLKFPEGIFNIQMSPAKFSIQLIDKCLEKNKLDILVDAIVQDRNQDF